MKQIAQTPMSAERCRKTTHRAQFLAQMHQVVPWATLCTLIEPHCADGWKGPLSLGLERMLRIYFLQQWFSLSATAAEEALDDSIAMRAFVGIDDRESVPDHNTIWRFRLLLEHRGLGRQMFAAVSQQLKLAGLKLNMGTIVDASISSAPSWLQRRDLACDRGQHQIPGDASRR